MAKSFELIAGDDCPTACRTSQHGASCC